ncbi:hydrogenase iron-sulfur subunit, partial [Candidatus Sumerlaeota bacterium]|nr:hydrogenase iron-sulfur subunit [Candidatus Sumerlaeota bacterium]
AFEAGARAVVVVTCPLGQCKLAEGNYRAQVRAGTIRRLLNEIGLSGERMILLHGDKGWQESDLLKSIEQAVAELSALPDNPMRDQ